MDGVDGALDGDMIEFWGKELPPGGKQFSVEVLNEPPVFQVRRARDARLCEARVPAQQRMRRNAGIFSQRARLRGCAAEPPPQPATPDSPRGTSL